jgi:hypothetical protein
MVLEYILRRLCVDLTRSKDAREIQKVRNKIISMRVMKINEKH